MPGVRCEAYPRAGATYLWHGSNQLRLADGARTGCSCVLLAAVVQMHMAAGIF